MKWFLLPLITKKKKKKKKKVWFSEFSVYWAMKGVYKSFFTQHNLKNAVPFLIFVCFFIVNNLVFKQDIGIPMGTDPVSLRANSFIYFFESN